MSLLSILLTLLVRVYSLYGGCLIMIMMMITILKIYDAANHAKNYPSTITATILVTSLKHIQRDACKKKPPIN